MVLTLAGGAGACMVSIESVWSVLAVVPPVRVTYLWSPYIIGQTIYILMLWFVLLSSFFPRLISAAADWMSAILPHKVWP